MKKQSTWRICADNMKENIMHMTTEPTLTRDEMLSRLAMDAQQVVFTKKDGTERVMNCTIDFMMIPVEHQPVIKEDAPERKISTETIRVFDLDINEWRSFRVDSVKCFTNI